VRSDRLGRAACVGCTLARLTSPARAQGVERAIEQQFDGALVMAAAVLLLPSSTGPELASRNHESADFRWVIAWPFQIPLPFNNHVGFVHRVVLEPQVAFGAADKAVFRGRIGYRYGYRGFVAGLGAGADRSALFVSPEVGVRLPPLKTNADFDFGALFVFRCDIEPRGLGVRTSAMLGWVLL
jgi:hypothetical protein